MIDKGASFKVKITDVRWSSTHEVATLSFPPYCLLENQNLLDFHLGGVIVVKYVTDSHSLGKDSSRGTTWTAQLC